MFSSKLPQLSIFKFFKSVLIFSTIFYSSYSLSYSCIPAPFNEQIEMADLIFVGKVENVAYPFLKNCGKTEIPCPTNEKPEFGPAYVTFSIEQKFKGNAQKELILYNLMLDHFKFRKGDKWIIFSSPFASLPTISPSCGGTQPYDAKFAEKIKEATQSWWSFLFS